MPRGMEEDLSPGDFVLDGDAAPYPKRGGAPCRILGPFLYCGQAAGGIKVALGMEVDLGPGHIVLDGDPAPLPKKEAQPQFSVLLYCGQTAG